MEETVKKSGFLLVVFFIFTQTIAQTTNQPNQQSNLINGKPEEILLSPLIEGFESKGTMYSGNISSKGRALSNWGSFGYYVGWLLHCDHSQKGRMDKLLEKALGRVESPDSTKMEFNRFRMEWTEASRVNCQQSAKADRFERALHQWIISLSPESSPSQLVSTGNWKAKKFIEPSQNTDAVIYNIFYGLEGEIVKDPGQWTGSITEFTAVRRPTVLCILHINVYQTSQSCVDLGEPVSIETEVPELLVSDTINRVFPINVMQAGPYRVIDFTPYSSDEVNCQIVWPDGQISCY